MEKNKTNRKCKDRLFKKVFGRKKDLLRSHREVVMMGLFTSWTEKDAEKFHQSEQKKALNRGRQQLLYDLVEDGDLKIEKAAEKTEMTIEAFRKSMLDAGRKPPE